MSSYPQEACSSDSPSSDEMTAYCHRGLEALEGLAEELDARREAAMTALGPPHSADQSREETDEGVHYRHPAAVAAGLYRDYSAGSSPRSIRRPQMACETAINPAVSAVTTPTTTTTTTSEAVPTTHTVPERAAAAPPPPRAVYSARAKIPTAQLWYYAAPAAATTDTATPTTTTTVPVATMATSPAVTAAKAPVSLRDFYRARTSTRTAGTVLRTAAAAAASAPPRRSSGAIYRDVTQLAGTTTTTTTTTSSSALRTTTATATNTTHTATTTAASSTSAPVATSTTRAAARKQPLMPSYYFNDGKHTIEVLPSSSSSSSSLTPATDDRPDVTRKTKRPERGRAHDRAAAADTRTRSAPIASGRHHKAAAATAAGDARSRSAAAAPRSRSSSNEETEDTKSSRPSQRSRPRAPVYRAAPPATAAPVAVAPVAAPAPTSTAPPVVAPTASVAEAPRETLCTTTTRTGIKTTAAPAVAATRTAPMTRTRTEAAAAAPTSYPRTARAAPAEARARSEPVAAVAATVASPPRTRPPPPPPSSSHAPVPARARLPVPLGPPAWVAFPRHTFTTGQTAVALAAQQPQPQPHRAAPPMPNYYANFHQLQLGGAGPGDVHAWSRPPPMVRPGGRLQPLPTPAPAAAVPHVARTPAHHGQRRRQPSPQSEMRISYSEVYQPLGLPVGSSPAGAGPMSLDPEHPLHDALERLDSARLLRQPLAHTGSHHSAPTAGVTGVADGGLGAVRLSPTRESHFASPWTTAPSAIRAAATDGDRSLAPSAGSTLARLVTTDAATTEARPSPGPPGPPLSAAVGVAATGAHDPPHGHTAVCAAPSPPLVSARGRPHLAPLPTQPARTVASPSAGAPVHRALDFDGRPVTTTTVAHTPLRGRLPPPVPDERPAQGSPSPSPSKPGLPTGPMAQASVPIGGVIAEHIPPALPSSPGRVTASSRSQGSTAPSAPPLMAVSPTATTTPSSISSARPIAYHFTASPSAPATAGQPVGVLQTASVGPSSTTTSSRHSGSGSGAAVMKEEARPTSPPPTSTGHIGQEHPPNGLYVSPRRPVPPMQSAAPPVTDNINNNTAANYYGAFHAARLRPAPAVTASQPRSMSPTPVAPTSAQALPPPLSSSGRALLPPPRPALAAPEHLSPRRLVHAPPPTAPPPTTTTAAMDTRLPAPRPRLGIPNDVELPDPPVPAAAAAKSEVPGRQPTITTTTTAARSGPAAGFGKRLTHKLFTRRGVLAPNGKPTQGGSGGKTYKPVRRSGSAMRGTAHDQDQDEGWETLPDAVDDDEEVDDRQVVHAAPGPAARALFPASHPPRPTPAAGVAQPAYASAAAHPNRRALHSTTLTPIKKRWRRALPWRR